MWGAVEYSTQTENPRVGGSIPPLGTTFTSDQIRSVPQAGKSFLARAGFLTEVPAWLCIPPHLHEIENQPTAEP